MIEIDGPLWFIGALVVFGLHALYARGWRRERKADLAWWRAYDSRSQQRHDEFMRAIGSDRVDAGWQLPVASQKRGQA